MDLLDKIVAPYGSAWVLDRTWGIMQGSQYHSICVICNEDFFGSPAFIVRVHPEHDMKMNRYACRDHFSAGGDSNMHPQYETMRKMRSDQDWEGRDLRRGREHTDLEWLAYAAQVSDTKISEKLRSLDERIRKLEQQAKPF